MTKTVGSTWVDLGGQWLGPTQDRALALVRDLGFETFPTWTRGDNLVVVEEHAKRYRGTISRRSSPRASTCDSHRPSDGNGERRVARHLLLQRVTSVPPTAVPSPDTP